MIRTRVVVLGAATVVAALGLCGCGGPANHPAATSSESSSAAPAAAPMAPSPAPDAPPTAPLPAPDALTGVLYSLADVNVAGADKIALVEQATPADADALDKFGRALADNGFTPLEFEATDLAWSPTEPGNVTATITVSTAGAEQPHKFTFPMTFTPHDGGWQLTRRTADMLLEMGAAAASDSPTPTP